MLVPSHLDHLLQASLAIVVLAAIGPAVRADDALPEPPEGRAWKLTWRDEFAGATLDETKWTAQPEGKRKGGWWSPRAVALDGHGQLVIRTFRDGDRVVDGCVSTEKKFEHAHGFYVARARVYDLVEREPAGGPTDE